MTSARRGGDEKPDKSSADATADRTRVSSDGRGRCGRRIATTNVFMSSKARGRPGRAPRLAPPPPPPPPPGRAWEAAHVARRASCVVPSNRNDTKQECTWRGIAVTRAAGRACRGVVDEGPSRRHAGRSAARAQIALPPRGCVDRRLPPRLAARTIRMGCMIWIMQIRIFRCRDCGVRAIARRRASVVAGVP